MHGFSGHNDSYKTGELVLEAILSSNIDSITNLNFHYNIFWFKHHHTEDYRPVNVDLLVELIIKQTSWQNISLGSNGFCSSST